MMSLIMSLLAGVAGQPEMAGPTAPAPVILTPSVYKAPLPPLPDGAEPAVRAVSSQPLPQLFSTDDYPAAARRNDEEGTVAFAIAIDPGGRVTACSIAQSSGSASLDATTCSIIQRRARFTPARDAGGRAVEDRSAGRVRWVLPRQAPIPYADRRMALVFTTDAAGAVTECRIEASEQDPEMDGLCASMMGQARAITAAAGRTIAMADRELVLEQGLLVGGAERARSIGSAPGQTRGAMFMLALEIDPAGVITRCTGAEGAEEQRRVTAACADAGKRKFVPSAGTAGSGPTRHAVRFFATYTRLID